MSLMIVIIHSPPLIVIKSIINTLDQLFNLQLMEKLERMMV